MLTVTATATYFTILLALVGGAILVDMIRDYTK